MVLVIVEVCLVACCTVSGHVMSFGISDFVRLSMPPSVLVSVLEVLAVDLVVYVGLVVLVVLVGRVRWRPS